MQPRLTANALRRNVLLLSLLSVCCLILFSISSCKKSKGTGAPPEDKTAPVVSSISPLKGPGLTEVTIEGANFSTTLSENKVTINGKEALVVEATATKLVVLVPMGAGTGPVKVQVGTKTGTGPNFEYEWVLVVNTIAGSEKGFANGTGRDAQFEAPFCVAVAADGSVFIADFYNHRIRKMTPEGVVTTFAGSNVGYVDGNISMAKFTSPSSIIVAPGGILYVSDWGAIRKITADGTVSAFVGGGPDNAGILDGQGTAAKLVLPNSLIMDPQGNIYFVDGGAGASTPVSIRKVTPGGMVSTLAGGTGTGYFDYQDGPGASAQFSMMAARIAMDSHGNIFVSDEWNRCIRKITPDGMVSTYAGVKGEVAIINGPLTSARFKGPVAIVIDSKDNMYIGDQGYIRKINTASAVPVVSTYAGNGVAWSHLDGPVMEAQIGAVQGMAFSKDESILYCAEIADDGHTIRRVMLQ